MTKHEQNLRGSNIKLLDFVSFLQKVTLKWPKVVSESLGLNVVSQCTMLMQVLTSHVRINLLRSLVLCPGGGRKEGGLFDFWNGVLICLFGVCNLGQAKIFGVRKFKVPNVIPAV